MCNQLTFSGSGELDNGLTVSLSFVQDNGEQTFDSHSLTISSDTMGTLKFNGEGGTTAANNIDGSAAGDIWDAFDGLANASGQTGNGLAATDAVTATAGDNAFMYTSPEVMDGLTLVGSYAPQASTSETRASGTGLGLNYTGIDGLTINYARADIVNSTKALSGDSTVMKASYAYGPVTLKYSNMEGDLDTADKDYELTSYAVSYTVSDELSVTYGMEDAEQEGAAADAEYEKLSLSYVTGGMTISAAMMEAEHADFTTDSHKNNKKWTLGASFAF